MKLLNYIKEESYKKKIKDGLKIWKEKIKEVEKRTETDPLASIVDHGLTHLNKIYKIIESLLLPLLKNNPDFFTSRELYYLIASAFLHDTGCKGLKENDEWEFIRENHSQLSRLILEKDYEDYALEEEDAKCIGLISAYHSKRAPLTGEHLIELKKKGKNLTEDFIKDGEINGEKVRFRLLAAILQICDACDRQKSRFREDKLLPLADLILKKAGELKDVEKNLKQLRKTGIKEELIPLESLESRLIKDIGYVSLYEKKYMLSIDKVKIENRKIILLKNKELNWEDETHIKNLESARRKIEEDLLLVKDILEQYGIYIDGVELITK